MWGGAISDGNNFRGRKMAGILGDGRKQSGRVSQTEDARAYGVRRLSAVLAVACAAAGPAAAEDAPTASGSGLEYSGTFYLWGSSLNGTQSIFGLPETEVDLRFGDILDNVDMAAAGIFQVQGDRFGFLGELNYVSLGAKATSQGGRLQGSMDSKAFFALAAATWRVAESDHQDVDLVGGLKYFRFDNDLSLSPGPLSASDKASWTDATIGVKASFDLAPKWTLKTWALVGTGGSDLSWDALVAFDYQFNDNWSAAFGFRAMGVDYSSGDFSYDMKQYGPIIGLTRRF